MYSCKFFDCKTVFVKIIVKSCMELHVSNKKNCNCYCYRIRYIVENIKHYTNKDIFHEIFKLYLYDKLYAIDHTDTFHAPVEVG